MYFANFFFIYFFFWGGVKQLLDNAKKYFVLWTYMPDVTQIETWIPLITLDIEK